jgi:hypothetical protein
MVDFYPVLARAVSRLADDGYQARQELYDHARKILVAQLRGRDSRTSAPEIMREQAALETAIRRVEVESNSAQSRTATGLRPHRLMANRGVVANGGTQTRIDADCLDEVVPDPQPRMSRTQIQTTPGDRMRLRPESKFATDTDAAYKLSVRERPPTDKDIRRGPSNIAEQLPLAVGSEDGIEASLEVRMAKLTSAVADKLRRDIDTRHDAPTFKKAKVRGMPAQAGAIDAGDDTAFSRMVPLGIALMVMMLVLIAVICFPIILMYNPRVIWLSEHLIDNPPMLGVIAITVGLFLLLFFPILGKRRKRSAIGFLRHLISMQPTARGA